MLGTNGWSGAPTYGFGNTGLLETDDVTVAPWPAWPENTDRQWAAGLTIMDAETWAGFRDPQITLTILSRSLSLKDGPATATSRSGSPLMITIDSDEAVSSDAFLLAD